MSERFRTHPPLWVDLVTLLVAMPYRGSWFIIAKGAAYGRAEVLLEVNHNECGPEGVLIHDGWYCRMQTRLMAL